MTTVFFDVDTQIDFLFPAGALYVANAESIIEQIAALNRYAASRGIPLVSTTDAHTENDPEFKLYPPHCVAGTIGQQKPASALLERRVAVANRAGAPAIWGAQQILLEKQTLNCFDTLHIRGLLDGFAAARYVVYGVVTEICVRFAALGLLATGCRVELVTDAVKPLDQSVADGFLRDFTASGGVLTASDTVIHQGR